MTIKKISEETNIQEQDIVDALEEVKILKQYKGEIYFCLDKEVID